MTHWQNIATAPRDGTVVLVWPWYATNWRADGDGSGNIVYAARWDTSEEGWGWVEAAGEEYEHQNDLTHWMPLPTPPSEGSSDE